jgi:cation diffusion facilitator CzcD-associated flavoprotein CzcO
MSVATPSSKGTLDCALCVVGAGYAGLNGLNAAARYLAPGARVVVIDKNETWGGQWVGQYDFVRLHQPYRLFTAGDQRWALKRDPAYLATRREVLDHLASVPTVSARHLDVRPLFGHAYVGHRVRDGHAEIDAAPVPGGASPSGTVRIRARRLLKATGTDIQMLPPFSVSSSRVRSVAVSDPVLTTPEFLSSDAPVYVIGSGKTAMDVVRHVAQNGRAGRRVSILLGSGMWFFARDEAYPAGPARYVRGTLPGDAFLRTALLFDGWNEASVAATLEREGILMNVFGEAGNCRYGILSLAEREQIRAGVAEVHRAHLVDVEGTRMVLREKGKQREVPVAEGSWFVNCTTHFRQFPHEPVLSDGDVVCAPQHALGFSGMSAYFLTHLWQRGELASLAPELFRTRVDVEPKLRFLPNLALMVVANLAMVGARLPLSVQSGFEGDLNKWYPLHRQLPMIARLLVKRREVLRRAERILRTRFSDMTEGS